MGRGGTDTNAVDFFTDGSGSANCFQGNVSSTFDPGTAPDSDLYPSCPAPPAPARAPGPARQTATQFADLVAYVAANPPETQQCSWAEHDHPAFEKFKPLDVTPGPTC